VIEFLDGPPGQGRCRSADILLELAHASGPDQAAGDSLPGQRHFVASSAMVMPHSPGSDGWPRERRCLRFGAFLACRVSSQRS